MNFCTGNGGGLTMKSTTPMIPGYFMTSPNYVFFFFRMKDLFKKVEMIYCAIKIDLFWTHLQQDNSLYLTTAFSDSITFPISSKAFIVFLCTVIFSNARKKKKS